MGRTLLSAAFEVDFDFAANFDVNGSNQRQMRRTKPALSEAEGSVRPTLRKVVSPQCPAPLAGHFPVSPDRASNIHPPESPEFFLPELQGSDKSR